MDTSILTRIQSDVQNNQVMLYMKGTPVFRSAASPQLSWLC